MRKDVLHLDKKTKNLLIGIVGAMFVLAIILIICVTLNSSEESNDSTEVISSESAGENRVENFYEEPSENSEKTSTNEQVEGTQMDYSEDIAKESEGVQSVLSLGGKDYTIPCQFSSFGNNFEYLETVPETLPAGGYQELHVVKDGVGTGVSLMVVNTTDKEISFGEAYVNFLSMSDGCDTVSASCIGLSYGSVMADIKQAIESGAYDYESATYDYEQTFLVFISDSVTASVTYDKDEAIVTKIVLEYGIN